MQHARVKDGRARQVETLDLCMCGGWGEKRREKRGQKRNGGDDGFLPRTPAALTRAAPVVCRCSGDTYERSPDCISGTRRRRRVLVCACSARCGVVSGTLIVFHDEHMHALPSTVCYKYDGGVEGCENDRIVGEATSSSLVGDMMANGQFFCPTGLMLMMINHKNSPWSCSRVGT